MYRKYYSYNDMPQQHCNTKEVNQCNDPKEEKPKAIATNNKKNGNFLGNIENDDVILAVIVIILLLNDCDDKILLLALAFVFISGFEM